MSDLIRREDALKAIVDERTHTLLQAWINVKKTVPSVDAIEVVRCKECKKCYKDTDALTKQTVLICQKHKYEFDWEKVEADDFCSYGEREGE